MNRIDSLKHYHTEAAKVLVRIEETQSKVYSVSIKYKQVANSEEVDRETVESYRKAKEALENTLDHYLASYCNYQDLIARITPSVLTPSMVKDELCAA